MNAPATVTQLPAPNFAKGFQAPKSVGKPKSIWLYGMPGTRKTSIAASIAKVAGFNKVLFIDIDQGAEVLFNDPILREKVEKGDIDVLPIDSLGPNALAQINATVDEICSPANKGFGYDAVIFDTVDVAQDVAEKVLKAKYADSKNTFGTYGDLGVWTDELVRKLHNSQFFTAVFTAHAKEQTTDAGAYRVLPRLSGSSKDAIGGIPSLVAYLEYQTHPETQQRHLVATVGESDKTITKNRYNLPQFLIDMDMPMLYAAIESSITTPAVASAAA